MNKIKKCLPWLIGAGFLIWVFISAWDMNLYNMPEERKEIAEDLMVIEMLQNEEGTFSYSGEGDPGLSEEEMNSPVRNGIPQTRSEMLHRILSSIRVIPFSRGGRYQKSEYPVFPEKAIWRKQEGTPGVDSLGFVLWAYYVLFQEEISHPALEYQKGKQIPPDELIIGDIGMVEYETGKPNHFGIFLGYDGEIPVFAHCSSRPYPGFPNGTVQLCTLPSEGRKFYGGEPVQDFKYFTRPEVAWDESEDSEEDILKNYVTDHAMENKNASQLADYGLYLYNLIQTGDIGTLFKLLNQDGDVVREYQVDRDLFGQKMASMRDIFAGKEIWLYNAMELPDSNAVIVRFCLSDWVYMESRGELIADTTHSIWMDFTFYMNGNGEIESFLPFPESMYDRASQYGFIKISQ